MMTAAAEDDRRRRAQNVFQWREKPLVVGDRRGREGLQGARNNSQPPRQGGNNPPRFRQPLSERPRRGHQRTVETESLGD